MDDDTVQKAAAAAFEKPVVTPSPRAEEEKFATATPPSKTNEDNKNEGEEKQAATKKNKQQQRKDAVYVGKTVSAALKKNIGQVMAKTFADHIITLAEKKYIANSKSSKEDDVCSSSSSDNDTEQKHKGIIDDIVSGKSFVGENPKKRKTCPKRKKSSPTKLITLWLSSAEDAFKTFANFLITLETSSEGRRTVRSLYQEDVRKAVEAVMQLQHLFDNASPIAKGLARFETYIGLLPSDKSSVLDSSLAVETATSRHGGSLNALTMFKDETKTLLCPRVAELLKHLSPHVAASVFNDVVQYVERSYRFYNQWGDLPGTEFRILLADINIKIMESALAPSTASQESMFGSSSSSSSLSSVNLSEEDSRTMIHALGKLREWKPLSKDYPTRLDKARDIMLLPETGNLTRIPVTASDLLQLVYYINALMSLERRNVFTSGFFSAACVVMSHCLSANFSPSGSGSLIRPSKIAAKVARDKLLSLAVVKNSTNDDGSVRAKNSDGQKSIVKFEEEEPMSEETSIGDSDSSGEEEEEDDDEKSTKRRRRKKVFVFQRKNGRKEKKQNKNDDDDDDEDNLTGLRNIIYQTGGFFYDSSDFGNKIREFIKSKNHVGLLKYASQLLDSGSNTSIKRLVASLLDLLILKSEQCEELKLTCSCRGKFNNNDEKSEEERRKEIVRMIRNPETDKNEMARYFLNEANPSLTPRHEAFVLTERLLPSDKKNGMREVTLSFFKENPKPTLNNDNKCPQREILPNLAKLTKEIVSEIAKSIVPVINKAASDNIKSIHIDNFVQLFSPLGKIIDLPSRIKSAMVVGHNPTKILFSPLMEGNTMAGLKLSRLLNAVEYDRKTELIRHNASDLSDPNNAAMSIILFPPSSNKDDFDEINVLSKLANGIFSIAEGCTAVVRSKDFDENGERGSYALVLDIDTMDKVVKFVASTLEDATAKALYVDDNMRVTRVLEGATFVEGALSYILDRRENVGECPRPTALAKYTMSEITGRYLKHLKKHAAMFKKPKDDDLLLAREEAASDRALVEEVTNRANNIVKSQIANAMGLALIMSAAIKVTEADAEEVDMRLLNGQTTTVENFQGTRANLTKNKSLIKSLAHLCISTAVRAASSMTKLSNKHFFDLIKEANSAMMKKNTKLEEEKEAGRGRGGDSKLDSELREDNNEHRRALLLGYTRSENYQPDNGDQMATSVRNTSGDWLSSAINSITGMKKKNNSDASASALSMIGEPSSYYDISKPESIIDKLNDMT